MKQIMQYAVGVSFAMLTTQTSFAFGIDRIVAELDASRGFKGATSFALFNDGRDNMIFTTAKAMKWDVKANGQFDLVPTDDIKITPTVQKIPAGESATFKVRYRGAPPEGEGAYRIMFEEILLPTNGVSKTTDGITEVSSSIDSSVSTGFAMSVPVYVSDFSVKADSLEKVSAKLVNQGNETAIEVDNQTNRHISITGYKINGKDMGNGLGVVLSKHQRTYPIDSRLNAHDASLSVSYGSSSRQIDMTGEK